MCGVCACVYVCACVPLYCTAHCVRYMYPLSFRLPLCPPPLSGGTYDNAKWSASEEGCDQCKNDDMQPQVRRGQAECEVSCDRV